MVGEVERSSVIAKCVLGCERKLTHSGDLTEESGIEGVKMEKSVFECTGFVKFDHVKIQYKPNQ